MHESSSSTTSFLLLFLCVVGVLILTIIAAEVVAVKGDFPVWEERRAGGLSEPDVDQAWAPLCTVVSSRLESFRICAKKAELLTTVLLFFPNVQPGPTSLDPLGISLEKCQYCLFTPAVLFGDGRGTTPLALPALQSFVRPCTEHHEQS